MAEPLSKRARSILFAVVTEFIATGEPVGSRTLAKKYALDLSAATIRNVLADLEDSGHLAQPHTSAGRVPTDSAFRLFIDALVGVRQLAPEDASKIADWFEGLPPGADLMRETGKLLSALSGVPAVLARSRTETRTLIKIRFISTRPGEMLSVIVLSDGSVENRFIKVERAPSDVELDRLHNMLEEAIEGRTLASVRDHFMQVLEERRDELRELQSLGLSLVHAAVEGAERTVDLIIEGQARLFDQPEFARADRVKELLQALEERERLVELLDGTLASRQVQVFLGEETAKTMGYPVSLVAAPYHEEDGQPGGALGIIGPLRMDYPFVVPLVGATAKAMSAKLAGTRGDVGAPPRGRRIDDESKDS